MPNSIQRITTQRQELIFSQKLLVSEGRKDETVGATDQSECAEDNTTAEIALDKIHSSQSG